MKQLIALLLVALSCNAQFLLDPYRFAPAETLILDTITNSWSAYSVTRKLRTAYAGNAFMLQKAGGSTNNIGFIGNLVDTNAISTFAAGGATYLSVLYDQGGNDRHMSQAPQWGDAGNALTNSFAITDSSGNFFLDADGHIMAKANPAVISYVKCISGTSLTVTNVSKFLVFQAIASTDNNVLVCGSSLESGTIKQTTSGGTRRLMDYANGASVISPTYNLNQQYLVNTFCGDFISTGDSIQINDGTPTTGDPDHNGGGVPSIGYDGLARTADAYVSEYFLFTVVITTEKTALMNDINTFYTLW